MTEHQWILLSIGVCSVLTIVGLTLVIMVSGRKSIFTRGVPDDKLKFVHTSNLWLIAMARLMESQGVNDQPLIDELYRRGRNGFETKGEK